MPQNNLRIIYNNLADSSTITASSSASANTSTANLKTDIKSLVWRSSTSTTTSVKANLLLDLPSSGTIGGVVLPFTNLTSVATIRIRGWSIQPTLAGTVDSPTITGGSQVFDSGVQLAAPWNTLNLPNLGTGANTYAYGGGTYARIWLPLALQSIACSFITIELVDTNPNKYIEVSRVVVGTYWSATYNTSFGITVTTKDLSTHSRTHAGDLVTKRAPRFDSITFDFKWLNNSDRTHMVRICSGNGMPKALLVSIFPDASTTDVDLMQKEASHMVYGKMVTIPGMQNHIFDMYSSSLEIEEV